MEEAGDIGDRRGVCFDRLSTSSSREARAEKSQQGEIDELHRQIGQHFGKLSAPLIAERDWLKKKVRESPLEARKRGLEGQGAVLSQRRQCELLGLNRAGLYYQPVGESEENLGLMRLLDEQYTQTPFYGVLRMLRTGSAQVTAYLRSLGHEVNPKRVRRLLRTMGLETVYQKPNTSQANAQHTVYPYLLRGLSITHPDQVWSTDITYIRLQRGFVYPSAGSGHRLVAVIDWYSRYVLGWALSTTLDADFCIEAVAEILAGRRCEIFNTDQGAQFTTPRFTQPLRDLGIQVSMDGRGRALDNIFVERLWRTVKYEYVYLQEIQTVQEARSGLGAYFDFYNRERFHQALGYRTPALVYFGGR